MTDIGILELKNITSAIKEKFGYDFTNYASSSFKRRILRILEIHRLSAEALLDKIKNGSFTKEEFLHEITVNVTEMFRDPSFWKAMRGILTTMGSSRDKIKIWHAGCSSGEEVYSMTILLRELNLLHKAEIVASDIDKNILAKAKEAKVNAKSMDIHLHNYERFSGQNALEKYFQKSGETYLLDKTLIEKVSFREMDLVKAVPFSKFDIVLCRNVLIYFNNTLQNDVLKLFSDCMFDGGIIAIGAKESISWCDIANNLLPVVQEEKIYKKKTRVN